MCECVRRGPHANPPQIIDANLPGRRRRRRTIKQSLCISAASRQLASISVSDLPAATAAVAAAADAAECHWGVKWLPAFHRNVLHKEHGAGALPVALVFSFSLFFFR